MKKILLVLSLLLAPLALAQTPAGAYSSPVLGGTGGACVGKNCFLLQSYSGYNGDTQEIITATWTSNATSLTTTTSIFQPSDNGKACWGMPQSNQTGPTASGTFTYVSATSGTCSPAGSLVGAPTGNGMFTWGHEDTTALDAATAALYVQPKCGTLVLPNARLMTRHGQKASITLAGDCGITIVGGGYTSSIIETMPEFLLSSCDTTGCWWNSSGGSNTTYQNFSVNYEFQSYSGQSSPGGTLFTVGQGGLAVNVDQYNGMTSLGNSTNAFSVNGQGAYCLGCFFNNVGNQTTQVNSVYGIMNNSGAGTPSGTLAIHSSPGVAFDSYGQYGGIFINNGTANLLGTQSAGQTSGSAASCFIGTVGIFDGVGVGVIGSQSAGSIGFQFTNAGSGTACTIYAKNTQFNGGSTGGCISSQVVGTALGILHNQGGNSCTGGPMLFSGTYVDDTGLFTGGSCTGTATSSSTLGLYGTGPNATTTTCTSTTIGSGIYMPRAGTVFELLATATHAGVNASSGAIVVLKNGVAQSMTCTIGTGTACQDGATAHQISVVAGDLISIRFTTQATEVLAGVQASLIIW